MISIIAKPKETGTLLGILLTLQGREYFFIEIINCAISFNVVQ